MAKDFPMLNPKRNSIGFLRLMLALAVIIAHAYELGGFGHDPLYYWSQNIFSLGAIAVDGFFVLSGVLITASFVRATSARQYLWNRILRIFPGYWACLLVTAIVVPLIFTQPIFTQLIAIQYVVGNWLSPAVMAIQSALGFVMPLVIGWTPDLDHMASKIPGLQDVGSIAGIFTDTPYPNAINGSLWTLGAEFRLYTLVAVLGCLGLLRQRMILLLLAICWLGYVVFFWKTQDLAAASSLRTSAHFLMGMAFYFWQPPLRQLWVVLSFVAGLAALACKIYPLVSPLTTAYLMLWLSTVLPFQGFGCKRDYSYGLYIYSFPLQQSLAALGATRFGLPVYLGFSIVGSFACAVMSWHGVEAKAMKLKHWFQRKSPEIKSAQI